jgi:hypothetical protein
VPPETLCKSLTGRSHPKTNVYFANPLMERALYTMTGDYVMVSPERGSPRCQITREVDDHVQNPP